MNDQNNAAQAAAQILTYLGFAQAVSMEPAADPRRDHIQALIESAMLSKLSAPVADERAAFAKCYSAIIKAIASIAMADGPDTRKADDPELLYRSPVMDDVVRIRVALDECSAALASAPVAGEAVAYLGDNVADRLDSMADNQPPGSQAQSDLYAAATIWRKHIGHHAAPQAMPDTSEADASPIVPGGPYNDPEDLIAALNAKPLEPEFAKVLADNFDNLVLRSDAAPQASEAVRNDGFSDGVITALEVMTAHGDWGGTAYCELLQAAGLEAVVRRAIDQETWESAGLDRTPMAIECRAALAAQSEQS